MKLSPGRDHERVPREAVRNVRWRLELLADARKDVLLQRGMVSLCRNDLLFWVNAFVWQVDPKQKGLLGLPGPFVLYPFQEEALLRMLSWVERGKDGLLEKSRQMGASWMMLMLFVWLWLFHDWQTFLFISRSEAAVEDATSNSLFWKIDYILRALPDWMKPHALRRRKRFFGNDDRNSSIFGEASTGQANVGGNTTAMGIDEFSQIKEAYEVLHRTSDSTQCRIFNGTHLGVDTAFYELTRRVDLEKLVLHWSQHPIYSRGLYRAECHRLVVLDGAYRFPDDYPFVLDGSPTGGVCPGLRSPWYDEQCRRKGSSRAVAMDLDIDPAGALTQFFDALMIRRLQESYARLPFWEGDIEVDPDLARPKQFTLRVGGPLRLWLHLPRNGNPPLGLYCIGGDISSGQGKTPSVLSIVDATTGQKVGEYVNNQMDPNDLAAVAVALCWAFAGPDGQGAKLGWEVPGPGLTFGKRVLGLGYRSIYWRESIELASPMPTDTPGWVSNKKDKEHLLQEYRNALRSCAFLNPSWDALQECLSFHYNSEGSVKHSGEDTKSSPADARANHGDRVIADAIANMLRVGRKPQDVPEERPESYHPGTWQGRRRLAEMVKSQEEAWL